MSFFPPAPEPQPRADRPREPDPPWLAPPEDEVAAVLPVAALLACDAHVAVVLRGVRVHSTGLALDIQALLRRAGADDAQWDDLQDRFGQFGRRRDRRHDPGLRIGLLLADGTPVVDGSDGSAPGLRRGGGGGSGNDDRMNTAWTWWLWPLPADGPLTVVVDWAAYEIAETRTVIDCTGIAALAAGVRSIWSDGDGSGPSGGQPSWTIAF